jgi:hypothetical protein
MAASEPASELPPEEARASTRIQDSPEEGTAVNQHYSLNSYRKDAVLLKLIIEGVQQGQFPELRDLISSEDQTTVQVIFKMMVGDTRKREELVRSAETTLNLPTSLVTSAPAFERFL